MEKLELRMYGLVPYNISPIQQAIQFGHAVVEYGLKYFTDEIYQDWAKNWKTFIILNGTTTNLNPEKLGGLNKHLQNIGNIGIKLSTFHEPDLGDQLTAFVFIVDERVFNREKYPDYNSDYESDFLDTSLTDEKSDYEEWKLQFNDTEENVNKILFLREYLHPKNIRMA